MEEKIIFSSSAIHGMKRKLEELGEHPNHILFPSAQLKYQTMRRQQFCMNRFLYGTHNEDQKTTTFSLNDNVTTHGKLIIDLTNESENDDEDNKTFDNNKTIDNNMHNKQQTSSATVINSQPPLMSSSSEDNNSTYGQFNLSDLKRQCLKQTNTIKPFQILQLQSVDANSSISSTHYFFNNSHDSDADISDATTLNSFDTPVSSDTNSSKSQLDSFITDNLYYYDDNETHNEIVECETCTNTWLLDER